MTHFGVLPFADRIFFKIKSPQKGETRINGEVLHLLTKILKDGFIVYLK